MQLDANLTRARHVLIDVDLLCNRVSLIGRRRKIQTRLDVNGNQAANGDSIRIFKGQTRVVVGLQCSYGLIPDTYLVSSTHVKV